MTYAVTYLRGANER